MRETVERPSALIDVTGFGHGIEEHEGGLRIGAATRNTAIAEHRAVRRQYPALSRAILAGASGQIRNMATLGGNLLQRTRCTYFYDTASRCNKREPGAGCDAVEGFNRIHAILGTSASCVATHPSDMCVALAALDAVVHLEGPAGSRSVALNELYRLPEDRPDRETVLEPGGTGQEGRLARGGGGPNPWRATAPEAALRGQAATAASFRSAAQAELRDARPLKDNGFKIQLAERTIVAVLGALVDHHGPGAASEIRA